TPDRTRRRCRVRPHPGRGRPAGRAGWAFRITVKPGGVRMRHRKGRKGGRGIPSDGNMAVYAAPPPMILRRTPPPVAAGSRQGRTVSMSLKTTARRLLTASRLLAPPPAPEDPCPHCGAADLVEPEDEHHVTLLGWTAEELRALFDALGNGPCPV